MLPSSRPGGYWVGFQDKKAARMDLRMKKSPKLDESGAGEWFSPISVLVRKQDCPVIVLCQLLRRKLATVLDGLAELVYAPDTATAVGLKDLKVVDTVFLLDESVKIGDDEGDFFG